MREVGFDRRHLRMNVLSTPEGVPLSATGRLFLWLGWIPLLHHLNPKGMSLEHSQCCSVQL